GQPVCVAHRLIFAYGVQAVWSIFLGFAGGFAGEIGALARICASAHIREPHHTGDPSGPLACSLPKGKNPSAESPRRGASGNGGPKLRRHSTSPDGAGGESSALPRLYCGRPPRRAPHRPSTKPLGSA